MTNELPVGQLFSHVYLSGGTLLRDKETFRRRLGNYCRTHFNDENESLGEYLRIETGLVIHNSQDTYYYFEDFLADTNTEIRYVLDVITLIWEFYADTEPRAAKNWHDFVARTLKEESMGYQLDERCGVHFFIDEAFERNRQSIIPALGKTRYAGVLTAYEGAYSALDIEPQNTKQAVRLIFEAVEILGKLMQPKASRLDKQVAEAIRDQAKASYIGDNTACRVTDKMFASFVDWIDGLHFYRHGQGTEEPVEPPLELAIFAISSGTNYLRWLVQVDSRQLKEMDCKIVFLEISI